MKPFSERKMSSEWEQIKKYLKVAERLLTSLFGLSISYKDHTFHIIRPLSRVLCHCYRLSYICELTPTEHDQAILKEANWVCSGIVFIIMYHLCYSAQMLNISNIRCVEHVTITFLNFLKKYFIPALKPMLRFYVTSMDKVMTSPNYTYIFEIWCHWKLKTPQ